MRISARRIRNTCVVLGALAMGGGVAAQDTARAPSPVFVGSEAENYLRYLQSLGEIPFHQWSMRGFSDAELRELRAGNAGGGRRLGSRWSGVRVLPASASVIYNTVLPYGINDGALWAGRGLTASVSGGVTARWGPLRVTLAPTAFWSENRAFGLMPTLDSTRPLADPLWSDDVDRPQRYGTAPYGRINPGQSGVRLEGMGGQIGFSWENLWWGPMAEFPYIVGSNASGFPHLSFGTSSPRNIWLGRLHTTVLYGTLTQTPYSPVDSGNGGRFAAGMIIVFQPRPFPGLEVGAARFFQVPLPDSGGPTREYFTHLFETFNKSKIAKPFQPRGPTGENSSADNQLASAFARWVFPRSGLDVYAEFGREDHNWDARDMMVELDHSAAIGFGIRKAWRAADGLKAFRFESMNHQISTLARHRSEPGAYTHRQTRQGHTQDGQLLGTGVGVHNGAATSLAYEQIRDFSTSTFSMSRFVSRDAPTGSGAQNAQHVLSFERSRSRGVSSVWYAAQVVADFNHNLSGADVMSLRFDVGLRRW